MWLYAVLALGAYLVGSFPTAYLFARWRRGIDIRTFGTGNVGGANVGYLEGTWATVVVGAIDFAKALVPTWLVLKAGLGPVAAVIVAIGVVVGHDWPVWLGFRGGRGAAATLGGLVAIFPIGFLWILGFMAVGKITATTAILHLVSVAFLPLVAWSLGATVVVIWALVAFFILMVVKRLEANRAFRVSSSGASALAIFRDRLLLDRDPEVAWKDQDLAGERLG